MASAAERRRAGATRPQGRVAPARQCAYTVIRRVSEQGAYADRAFHAEASSLEPRDRALAMQLAYGTVQRKRTLDDILERLSGRPPERLDAPLLAALRLGLFQLAWLDGVAAHAAVDDSVELAKQHANRGHGLVNAVLRRAARSRPELLAGYHDDDPHSAAIMHSVPDWLAELWWRELGPETARELLRTVNQPPESAVRVNTLKAPEALALPVPAHAVPELPEARVVEAPFDLFGSRLWQQGLVMPQSRGSIAVARSLGPKAGERVLDVCAAPGAKTTHLAALIANRGEVVAVEVHPGRARALSDVVDRMGASCVRVLEADARRLPPELGSFDAVLVDPPCSGLGTLQSRPDLRWQQRRGEIASLAAKQLQLLAAAAAFVRPGGRLVYSVCTISRAEGAGLVARWLAETPDFRLEHERQLLPSRERTDGFYIARLARAG